MTARNNHIKQSVRWLANHLALQRQAELDAHRRTDIPASAEGNAALPADDATARLLT